MSARNISLGALIKTSVLSEVSSCYAARELSIRYVFIERKRGDGEIFRADILFGSIHFTGIRKLISVMRFFSVDKTNLIEYADSVIKLRN